MTCRYPSNTPATLVSGYFLGGVKFENSILSLTKNTSQMHLYNLSKKWIFHLKTSPWNVARIPKPGGWISTSMLRNSESPPLEMGPQRYNPPAHARWWPCGSPQIQSTGYDMKQGSRQKGIPINPSFATMASWGLKKTTKWTQQEVFF